MKLMVSLDKLKGNPHFVRYDQIRSMNTAPPPMRQKGILTRVTLLDGEEVFTTRDVFELIDAVEKAEAADGKDGDAPPVTAPDFRVK